MLFRKPRCFKVRLSNCIDEFGNSFGVEGTHFFVRGLANAETDAKLKNFLKNYYHSNPIRSFNEVVGRDIGSEEGTQYFCPWEANRVRPLAKFLISHKAGPTPEPTLNEIVIRLTDILNSIRKNGYRQSISKGNSPRVIELCDSEDRKKYIIRDGQHRCAVLSHLGFENIFVCYEAEYWQPSPIFLELQSRFGRTKWVENTTPQMVRESEAASWPHVLEKTVTVSDAETFFADVFCRAPMPGI